jgi:LPXTG-motif cell wall-anchored protein
MLALIVSVLATVARVPDAGPSGILLGLGILSLGIAFRVFKKRK